MKFNDVSREVKKKAYWLFRSGKVRKDMESEKRIFFSVFSRETHSVIFDKDKNEFSCDCNYFSLHFKPCSHIIAVKLFLEEINNKKVSRE